MKSLAQNLKIIIVVALAGTAILAFAVISFYFWTKTKSPKIADGGFISQQPCGPPCFYGIIPGETTEKDARNILHNLGEFCTDWNNTQYGGYRGTNCHKVDLFFQDNTVGGIRYYPDLKISVSQLIEIYGEPDHMFVYISSILPDEPRRSNAMLLYDRYQLILHFSEQEGEYFTINDDTNIKSINYGTRIGYKEYVDLITHHFVPWKGFSTYEAEPPGY